MRHSSIPVVRPGDHGPPRAGHQDWQALHLALQGLQPLRQSEEGVQGHLLAGALDPRLPCGTVPPILDLAVLILQNQSYLYL